MCKFSCAVIRGRAQGDVRWAHAGKSPIVFSDAEYDSPEKQKRIELLGQDRDHRGAAGQGIGSQ